MQSGACDTGGPKAATPVDPQLQKLALISVYQS